MGTPWLVIVAAEISRATSASLLCLGLVQRRQLERMSPPSRDRGWTQLAVVPSLHRARLSGSVAMTAPTLSVHPARLLWLRRSVRHTTAWAAVHDRRDIAPPFTTYARVLTRVRRLHWPSAAARARCSTFPGIYAPSADPSPWRSRVTRRSDRPWCFRSTRCPPAPVEDTVSRR